MQKNVLYVSLLTLSVGIAGLAFAEDTQVQRHSVSQETYSSTTGAQPAAVQASTPVPTAMAPMPMQNGTMAQRTVTQEETTLAQNNPPIRWSILEGEVTHIDKANNVIEIRLKGSNHHIGVPVVEKRVGIYRHGDHQYALSDVQPGDDVTLRNLNTSAL